MSKGLPASTLRAGAFCLSGMEMDSAEILVLQASYSNPVHAEAIGIVLNHYAEDPMGGGHPVAPELLQRLPEELIWGH